MNSRIAIGLAGGLALIGLALVWIFHAQRGAHVDLPAKILQIRTLAVEDNACVAVADFEVTNASDYPFMSRSVTLILEDPDGTQHPGLTSSEGDAVRFFAGMPALGQKKSTSLVVQGTVPAHATEKHMVLAQFSAPESKLKERKRFLLRIEEVDGKVFEIPEK